MVSDVFHFHDIVLSHLTPPFHLLLILFSRSLAQTWAETGRPSPAPEGFRKAPGNRDSQPVGQPSSISAQLSGSETPSWASSRVTPDPTLFLEFSQMLVPWLAWSQPCPGQPCTDLRKGEANRLCEGCGCSYLRQGPRPHISTNSIRWASGLHLSLQNEDKGTCSGD